GRRGNHEKTKEFFMVSSATSASLRPLRYCLSYEYSSTEEPTPPTTRPPRPDIPQRLIIQEQRNERRQFPNLLIGEQMLRRWTVDRHQIDRPVLRRANPVVRLIEIVLLRQRREILRHRRPERIDRSAVRLVEDRDAVGNVVAQ